jgi:hypothetical protein
MREEQTLAEIEDFLEGFNQPTYRGMRVNGVRVAEWSSEHGWSGDSRALRRSGYTEPPVVSRLELVNCGKGACKHCGGRRPVHGPYCTPIWKENGRTRSRYIGKELPAA